MGSTKDQFSEDSQSRNILDEYSNKVFRLVVFIVPFFFDVKLVRTTTFLILLSMVISWFFNGDNLFFKYNRYDNSIRDFLEKNPDITGIMFVEFSSNYKPDLDNILILRMPVTTFKLVKVLNGDNGDSQLYSEEAYSINFTAPTAKLLIVDDNEINITIAKGLLAPTMINIDSALSGKEAIERLTPVI